MIWNTIQTILIYAVAAIPAITLHEVAHGFVASLFGDDTARRFGRLRLNPLAHIDPAGTILVPGLLLLGGMLSGAGGILFGWAKPVPVNFSRLGNPKRDMVWVALAGPLSNLFQALLWALVARSGFELLQTEAALRLLVDFCSAGINVNLMLMAFNLLPVLPLDGGRILTGLLPGRWALEFSKWERFGIVVVLVLIATGLASYIIAPLLTFGRMLVRTVL